MKQDLLKRKMQRVSLFFIPAGCRAILMVLLFTLFSGCGVKTLEDVEACKNANESQKLIKIIGKRDVPSTVQDAAIVALGEMKAEDSIPVLIQQLNTSDFGRACKIVDAFIAIGNEESIKQLILLIKHKDSRIVILAINGLGTLKSKAGVEVLSKTLDSSDPKIASKAALALGSIGGEEATAALVGKIKSPTISLRLNCVKALSMLKSKEARDGLALAFGDHNDKIRRKAIEAIIDSGLYKPYVLAALRSDNVNEQKSALTILKSTKMVLEEKTDKIWYKLAWLATKASYNSKMKVDPDILKELVNMGSTGAEIYFQILQHKSPIMREYASRALEQMGESIVPIAEKVVNKYAKEEAKEWYSKRSYWPGAPSGKLDLWGAITALDADFKKCDGDSAEAQVRGAISSTQDRVRREFIPSLILLASGSKERQIAIFGTFSLSDKKMKAFEKKAKKRLLSNKKESQLPLLIGMNDSDPKIANICVKLLGEMGDHSVVPKIEQVLTQKINKNEKGLSASAFYEVLQQFNAPSSEAILKKVRPNKMWMKRMFEKRFPGYRVISMKAKNVKSEDPTIPVAFKIQYFKDEKNMGELLVRFVRTDAGDWEPNPPLPRFIKKKK